MECDGKNPLESQHDANIHRAAGSDNAAAAQSTMNTPDAPVSSPPGFGNRLLGWIGSPRFFGIIALVAVAALWITTYRQLNALEDQLAKRLSEFDARSTESRTLAAQAQQAMQDLQIKTGVLEQKLNESQNQQVALEAMYQELARGRDEVIVAEIEQLLLSASQQLQLAGNVKAALIALQSAETRLQHLDRPQLLAIRKAINRDIERLRAAPLIDVPGMTLKLDGLLESVDALSLAPGKPAAASAKRDKPVAAQNWWQRFAAEAWNDFTNLVRVQNMQKPQIPLLTPEQSYYARENLKLRLLSARLALLARDEVTYKADLSAAAEWIQRYYDTNDKQVKAFRALLQQLEASAVNVTIPDIAMSLSAVRGFKPSTERATR